MSAYNLCAFQLDGQEVSLYEAGFYDVADQLAQCLSVTYDGETQEIAASQNDIALTTSKWETSDFVGNPLGFYCGSQLSYRYQDGAWYVDCSIEILDSSGNSYVSSYLPTITGKMSLHTNETGQISDCSVSDFSVF